MFQFSRCLATTICTCRDPGVRRRRALRRAPHLLDPQQLIDKTKLAVSNGVYAHGYVMVELNGPVVTVGYFQEKDDRPFYAETLPTPATV